MGIIEIKNLTYYYPEAEKASLLDVNLKVNEGEIIFLTGSSGCGKSTLLKTVAGLLPEFYGGRFGGEISYKEKSLNQWDKKLLAQEIGIIFQNPEQQSIMTIVEQEIAFGMENTGIPRPEMRRRAAEALALFGLSPYRQKAIYNLSGGEKQKVILAAIIAMHPKVLLLDEPTSQLDPVAAQDFLFFVQRLNQEWGLTVLLVEQRIDRCFHLADKVIIMEKGRVALKGSPRLVAGLADEGTSWFIPPAARVFKGITGDEPPLSIKEGRERLKKIKGNQGSALRGLGKTAVKEANCVEKDNLCLEVRNLQFAYPGNGLCLKKINLKLFAGTVTVVLGENGTGKTTLLKNINGLLRPQKGKILWRGNDITSTKAEARSDSIGFLSQNPEDYLFNDSVAAELAYGLESRGLNPEKRVEELLHLLALASLRDKHPRDLSGGEKQRVALGTVLAPDPEVLLLDEPTRGLDIELKRRLSLLLHELKKQGKAVLIVTHDIEFAAEAACRIVMMADGEIIADGPKDVVLEASMYYSPQVNRMFKGIYPGVMTVEEGRRVLSFFAECNEQFKDTALQE